MPLSPLIYVLDAFYDISIPKLDPENPKFRRKPLSKFGHSSKNIKSYCYWHLFHNSVNVSFSGLVSVCNNRIPYSSIYRGFINFFHILGGFVAKWKLDVLYIRHHPPAANQNGQGPQNSKPEPGRGESGKHLQGNHILTAQVPLEWLYGYLTFEQTVLICRGERGPRT